MGFFNFFSNKTQTNIVKTNKYTWDNIISDSLILIDGTFYTYLFTYSKSCLLPLQGFLSKLNNNVNDEERERILNNIDNFIINNINSIHYEEDLQYSFIQGVVCGAVYDLFCTIETVKNIDGEKTKQYFSGFTLNEDHVLNTLTQEISQIISREYNLYLRQYLTDLENFKRYAEFRKNNENKGIGNSLFTNFMGGVVAASNPLIGFGMIAKGMYDCFQNDQNENKQIDQFNSLRENFFNSIDRLSECEHNVSLHVSSFVKGKISTAFNELGAAVNKYCNDNNSSIDYICNAIYQDRISSYSDIYAYDTNDGPGAKLFLEAFIRYMAGQKDLHSGTRSYFQKALKKFS